MTVPGSIRERTALVDTSAFFADLDATDADHEAARAGFQTLAEQGRPLVTTNLIVAETYNLARRVSHSAAVRWLRGLTSLSLVFADESDHQATSALLERYSDKRFSYADASSFVIMERLRIPLAFTFDRDFRQYGIAVMP
jgi:predicted nucleic acid-binding protein